MPTRGDLAGLLAGAAHRLRACGSPNPQNEARFLLADALGMTPGELAASMDTVSPAAEVVARLESSLSRREAGEPVQYVLGSVPFCEVDLEVGPGVLIPRSETEVLVEEVSAALRSRRRGGIVDERLRAVDVGTGTGAILLALSKRFPGLCGLGIDLSDDALSYAARNETRNAPRDVVGGGRDQAMGDRRLIWVRGDLLECVAPASVDLVVSNPPYIPTAEVAALPSEVRDHEPQIALDGGEDGLVYVRRLIRGAHRVLRAHGILAMELALGQPGVIARELGAQGFVETRIYRDLTGRARGVLARRA